jgi:aldehyde dehydrogenase (NAD+)
MINQFANQLTGMQAFYNRGSTRSYSFRKEQLLNLKKTLLKYEGEIYHALYADLGKSKEEAYASELGLVLAEINHALNNLRNWMEPKSVRTTMVNLPSSSKIYRDSLGVVLIISPWNYPLNLLLIPLVGAIAGGNCVVLKPSELSPATSAITEKIINETFSPPFVKLINGDGAEIVPALMNEFRFDHVFYTGSVAVGKTIYKMAAEKLIPVTLELGGKSPGIAEADANINVTARRLVLGKFLNAGQTCIAPDYLLVHNSIKDELVKAITKTIENFYSHDSSASYDYGKIINERRFDKLVTFLQQGIIIYGGRHDRSKLWIEPTLMDNVPMDSPLMTEEIFGPILPIISFETMNEAADIVQKNPNPLAFYLFTSNSKNEKLWVDKIHFGGGCINNTAWYFANKQFPFGGVGNSGIGAYHGKYTFDVFTREKSVMKTPTWFDPGFKYPPMKGRLNFFKKFIN